jgi:primosomal protein N' (replication factor Y)
MTKYKSKNLFAEEIEELSCRHIIRVAFESAADTEFDYGVPDKLWPIQVGQRIEAPFGRKDKLEKGFCVEADVPFENSFAAHDKGHKLKTIINAIDKDPLLDSELMDLAKWISGYYVCPLGQVLAAMVPAAVKKGAGVKTQQYVYLTTNAAETKKIIDQLRGKKQKQIIKHLLERQALDSDSAMELQNLLSAIDCGREPLKRLAEKKLLKIARKTILKSLPAIPKGISIKPEGYILLNEDQQKVFDSIKAQINSGKFGVTLLHGVTDSGKKAKVPSCCFPRLPLRPRQSSDSTNVSRR